MIVRSSREESSESEISPMMDKQTQQSVFVFLYSKMSFFIRDEIAFLEAGGGPYRLGSFSMMC